MTTREPCWPAWAGWCHCPLHNNCCRSAQVGVISRGPSMSLGQYSLNNISEADVDSYIQEVGHVNVLEVGQPKYLQLVDQSEVFVEGPTFGEEIYTQAGDVYTEALEKAPECAPFYDKENIALFNNGNNDLYQKEKKCLYNTKNMPVYKNENSPLYKQESVPPYKKGYFPPYASDKIPLWKTSEFELEESVIELEDSVTEEEESVIELEESVPEEEESVPEEEESVIELEESVPEEEESGLEEGENMTEEGEMVTELEESVTEVGEDVVWCN